MSFHIIAAGEDHTTDIIRIFRTVTDTGTSYVYPEDMSDADIIRYWFTETALYVAIDDTSGTVIGTFVIRDNKPGRGAHICNAGFMVDPAHRRKGIGGAMCDRAIIEATAAGYRGMQFNVVVSTNIASITLWRQKGFTIIGTVPGGYRHKTAGFVDLYIMFRELTGAL